jgi:hypothetical protein
MVLRGNICPSEDVVDNILRSLGAPYAFITMHAVGGDCPARYSLAPGVICMELALAV